MKNNILFDLDGTIIDSSEGIIKSMNYALSKAGMFGEYDIKSQIGASLLDMVKNLLHGISNEDAKMIAAYYRERYSVTGLYECSVYEGIHELLDELKKSKYNLYIVTSKPYDFAVKILERLNLDTFFNQVAGPQLSLQTTPKAKLMSDLIDSENIFRDSVIMIGDRPEDIISARINKVDSIAVLYGFGTFDIIMPEKPTEIASEPKELYNIISKMQD